MGPGVATSGGGGAFTGAGGGGGGGGYYAGQGGEGGFDNPGGGGGGGSDFCTDTTSITGCTVISGAGTQTVAGSAAGDAQVVLTFTLATHIQTTDPLYYVHTFHYLCIPVLPHGRVTLYNCFLGAVQAG